jgi:CheY-like chemotaxis protein
MNLNPQNNHRILVIDDDPDTHDLIRKMLFRSTAIREKKQGSPELTETHPKMPLFEIDSAYQGQEGLVLIEESLRQNRPYSLAFVDVRMPPGWAGWRRSGKSGKSIALSRLSFARLTMTILGKRW